MREVTATSIYLKPLSAELVERVVERSDDRLSLIAGKLNEVVS